MAAWGDNGRIHKVDISEFPQHQEYRHLLEVFRTDEARPLSHRGASGFFGRLSRGNLGRYAGFRDAVFEHVRATAPSMQGMEAVS